MSQKKNSEQNMEPPSVATIPWVTLKTNENMTLEQTSYFKNSKCKGENRTLIRQYLQLMDNTFPYYLPKRYHTMDVIELKNKTTSRGQYWANASHFFVTNHIHSRLFWAAVLDDVDAFNSLKLKPLISSELRSTLFTSGLEQCESPADFLLNPWVLVQLPFQPIVLHQWLVALLAETYKFKAEMVDFRHMPFIDGIYALKELVYLDMVLQEAIFEGFTMLQVSYAAKSCISNKDQLSRHKYFFSTHVLGNLPMIEFIVSGEAVTTLRGLKKLVWNKNIRGACGPITLDHYKLSNMNFLYAYDFMDRGKVNEMFTTEDAKLYSSDGPPNVNDKQAWFDKVEKKYGAKANWKDITDFVDEVIIQTGRLKGVSRETIFQETRGDLLILYYYNKYMKHKKTCSSSPGVCKSDTGVSYTIRALTSDYFMADAVAAITNRLNTRLVMGAKKYRTYFNFDHESYPNTTFQIANAAVKKVKTQFKKKMSIEDLLKKLKNTIGVKVTNSESCPDLEKLNIEEVAAIFEVRIKWVMLNMIERQYESFSGRIQLYPEIQFVQYILPCFVASLLELAEESSDTRLEETKRYAQFIHELIKTFETPENIADSYMNFMQIGYTYYTTVGATDSDKFFIFSKADTIIASLGVGSSVAKDISNKFLVVLTDYLKVECPKNTGAGNAARSNYLFWTGQLAKYLSRIQEAIRKTTTNRIVILHDRLFSALTFVKMVHDNTSLSSNSWEGQKLEMHERTESLMEMANYRICKLIGRPWQRYQKGALTEIGKDIEMASMSMSIQQILGLVFYHVLPFYDVEARQLIAKNCKTKPFRLDPATVAFSFYIVNDLWKLKQLFSTWMNDFEGKTDLSLAPLYFALKVVCSCYGVPLGLLDREENPIRYLVKFARKGDITFSPLEHCRWCGIVGRYPVEFKLCKECAENPEFPDKNLFCSETCETEALNGQHTEDHARFLLIKLGISS